MIEVAVTQDGEELAYIRIEKLEEHEDATADYSVHFAVHRALGAVGVHQRAVARFPRLKYNALALVLQALNALDPRELELESDTRSSDLAWRFGRARKSLPR